MQRADDKEVRQKQEIAGAQSPSPRKKVAKKKKHGYILVADAVAFLPRKGR
jgi:hypothetical protein